jgi:hypothetical protein
MATEGTLSSVASGSGPGVKDGAAALARVEGAVPPAALFRALPASRRSSARWPPSRRIARRCST